MSEVAYVELVAWIPNFKSFCPSFKESYSSDPWLRAPTYSIEWNFLFRNPYLMIQQYSQPKFKEKLSIPPNPYPSNGNLAQGFFLLKSMFQVFLQSCYHARAAARFGTVGGTASWRIGRQSIRKCAESRTDCIVFFSLVKHTYLTENVNKLGGSSIEVGAGDYVYNLLIRTTF